MNRIVEARDRAIAAGCTPHEVNQRLEYLTHLWVTGILSETGFAKMIDPDWLVHLEEDLLDTPVQEWIAEAERHAELEWSAP